MVGTIALESRPNRPTNSSQCLPCMATLIKRKWNSQYCTIVPFYIRWQHLIFYKEAWGIFICWAVRPALQSNSSKCIVLILHRQLGNLIFYKKLFFLILLHGITFSIRPEEAVLLDSESLSARNNIFCYLRKHSRKYYTTE